MKSSPSTRALRRGLVGLALVAIALGLKVAFIGLAISGVATLWMAILADTGASLLVTANGLRLLGVRQDRERERG